MLILAISGMGLQSQEWTQGTGPELPSKPGLGMVADRMGVRIAAWGRRQMDTCERCLGVTGCEGCLDLSW